MRLLILLFLLSSCISIEKETAPVKIDCSKYEPDIPASEIDKFEFGITGIKLRKDKICRPNYYKQQEKRRMKMKLLIDELEFNLKQKTLNKPEKTKRIYKNKNRNKII